MRRDDPSVFQVGPPPELPATPAEVIDVLTPLVTAERLARLARVADARTLDVAVVLEDITDPHNISAVLRSADAFGIQRVHVLAGRHGFLASHRVAKGTHRWLDLTIDESVEACAARLHADGYRIFVAAMGGDRTPEHLAAEERVAIVFGNEHRGVSDGFRDLADGTFAIPMQGFVESLNVSVAAAISMYAATRGRSGTIPSTARDALLARFLMTSVHDAERIVVDALRER